MSNDAFAAALDASGLDLLFRNARSQNAWQPRDVPVALIRDIYELLKLGPTSANSCPARFVFIRDAVEKRRLLDAVSPGNHDKVLTAPVVCIIGHDLEFYEQMTTLFPHNDSMRLKYAADGALAGETAFRNGTLQGAWLMLAARALGLDCGPMSGFDNAAVDRLYFADSRIRSNFICALGYGDPDALFPRLPRLDFEQACEIR